MDIIIFGCWVLFAALQLGMIKVPLGKGEFLKYLVWGVSLFLVIVGNVLGKTQRNFFMGIRVPWTLASEANWRATHRFTGRQFVISGIALIISSTVYIGPATILLGVGIPIAISIIYSYLYYSNFEKANESQ